MRPFIRDDETAFPLTDIERPTRALGLDSNPRYHLNASNSGDLRTGIPPVFSAAARARWAADREARSIERYLPR